MKRKLFIVPLLVALLIVSMLPTMASEETTNGVAVTDCAGSPGNTVKMTVSLDEEIFADNIAVRFTYDTDVLTLVTDSEDETAEVSGWLLEDGLSDVSAVQGSATGIAVWGVENAIDVEGDILELVFVIAEETTVDTAYAVDFQLQAQWTNAAGEDEITLGNEVETEEGLEVQPVTASATVTVKELATVSGTVTSYGSSEAPVTVELLDSEGNSVDSVEVAAGSTEYSFAVGSGAYTLRFSKTKHCPREYEVDMTNLEDTVVEAEILLYGDVTGDGKILAKDAQNIMWYCTQKSSVLNNAEDYILDVADVTEDGRILAKDAQNIMWYCTQKSSVFDSLK